MIDARFRPLVSWTRKPGLRYVSAPFKTPYNRTLDKLEYELGQLKATEIIIEAGFRLSELRNDGWPRGGSAPGHPGIIIYFKGKFGPMEFPCGTYAKFQDNIHAIALTLENLRAINRYGVTLGHEQYVGFKQIEAPSPPGSGEDPAQIVRSLAGVASDIDLKAAYRIAAKRHHPDAGGDPEKWAQLHRAHVSLKWTGAL